jgi:hypothetical protein
MTPTDFAVFKYDADGSKNASVLQIVAVILFALSLPVCFAIHPALVGVAFFLLFLLLFLTRSRERLCLGPRYLVCGKQIVYYRNIEKLELNAAQGSLLIHSTRGNPVTIAREHFPTNARKAPKVAANKQAKFDKVAQKIIQRVRAVRPDVTLLGIDPGQL